MSSYYSIAQGDRVFHNWLEKTHYFLNQERGYTDRHITDIISDRDEIYSFYREYPSAVEAAQELKKRIKAYAMTAKAGRPEVTTTPTESLNDFYDQVIARSKYIAEEVADFIGGNDTLVDFQDVILIENNLVEFWFDISVSEDTLQEHMHRGGEHNISEYADLLYDTLVPEAIPGSAYVFDVRDETWGRGVYYFTVWVREDVSQARRSVRSYSKSVSDETAFNLLSDFDLFYDLAVDVSSDTVYAEAGFSYDELPHSRDDLVYDSYYEDPVDDEMHKDIVSENLAENEQFIRDKFEKFLGERANYRRVLFNTTTPYEDVFVIEIEIQGFESENIERYKKSMKRVTIGTVKRVINKAGRDMNLWDTVYSLYEERQDRLDYIFTEYDDSYDAASKLMLETIGLSLEDYEEIRGAASYVFMYAKIMAVKASLLERNPGNNNLQDSFNDYWIDFTNAFRDYKNLIESPRMVYQQHEKIGLYVAALSGSTAGDAEQMRQEMTADRIAKNLLFSIDLLTTEIAEYLRDETYGAIDLAPVRVKSTTKGINVKSNGILNTESFIQTYLTRLAREDSLFKDARIISEDVGRDELELVFSVPYNNYLTLYQYDDRILQAAKRLETFAQNSGGYSKSIAKMPRRVNDRVAITINFKDFHGTRSVKSGLRYWVQYAQREYRTDDRRFAQWLMTLNERLLEETNNRYNLENYPDDMSLWEAYQDSYATDVAIELARRVKSGAFPVRSDNDSPVDEDHIRRKGEHLVKELRKSIPEIVGSGLIEWQYEREGSGREGNHVYYYVFDVSLDKKISGARTEKDAKELTVMYINNYRPRINGTIIEVGSAYINNVTATMYDVEVEVYFADDSKPRITLDSALRFSNSVLESERSTWYDTESADASKAEYTPDQLQREVTIWFDGTDGVLDQIYDMIENKDYTAEVDVYPIDRNSEVTVVSVQGDRCTIEAGVGAVYNYPLAEQKGYSRQDVIDDFEDIVVRGITDDYPSAKVTIEDSGEKYERGYDRLYCYVEIDMPVKAFAPRPGNL